MCFVPHGGLAEGWEEVRLVFGDSGIADIDKLGVRVNDWESVSIDGGRADHGPLDHGCPDSLVRPGGDEKQQDSTLLEVGPGYLYHSMGIRSLVPE